MTTRQCPALLIAAPASGQGKTTVTAALARLHHRQGRRVRVFKCGPDFLDPMILQRASGQPVYQLDLWMIGEQESRRMLWGAAGEADLILIEGVMGLFDGNPSAADLARHFGVPVMGVIDGSGMAQTFGAMAHGLAHFQLHLPFSGVLGNKVGSARHGKILRDSLPAGMHWYGALPRSPDVALPSRHLGLVQADELLDLDARLDAAADALEASAGSALPAPVDFEGAPQAARDRLLAGVRIGVARDPAFAFIYQANLDVLESLGAELVFFSPLRDSALPDVESLYLPGGYPELHLEQLASNRAMQSAIRQHQQSGKPILAECGGMLYLCETLTDAEGTTAEMVGLVSGQVTMQKRLAALALQEVSLPEGSLRGHTFHHSALQCEHPVLVRGECPNYKRTAEAVYRLGRLTASYIHLYFPGNPRAVAALFQP
ncbi:hydrogenobyrinic acid a,c-diamide synthase (glutamine-hydrolysing) /cobyrinate a,c-diamide synthase [Halopseudomonas xinjiangensis]|uniref:Hydrogenobyrinate a,c-diamide synthase n=1 Tax=Halopseudomonas xinjiangensis TaxID=487184 RepID=A0A1H1SA13_9GAMM|nr:cobyrinate a,c-diamide synthase [Halopseudomonas xinjiangensis]SDS44792.1 hydrogenobyrinic acid a,c-diamide synthase (glutamine-hydrolysing) /cobyrinate a,c-diamide synthase [Halopseudomonas xinjiangensis]